ncbi:MAG: carbohydrate porin [Candidatus Dadabacteria bacterium]|nr:carbohydrate porin [Candidatus Dadabacteria bacterium]
MPNFLLTILVLFSAFAALTPARAGEALSSRRYLTGDWGGARQRLADWGLTPSITYSADIQGNPAGGFRKKIEYAGLLNVYLDFDLEKIFGLGRTKLVVSGFWALGNDLSKSAIGNYFTVADDFNGDYGGLYQLFVQTTFAGERLLLAAGRMGVGDDFAALAAAGNYVNDAINPIPDSLAYNISAFLSNPDAALGARFTVKPAETFYIAGGVYNADPDSTRISGFTADIDFTLDDGVLLIAEAGFTPGGDDAAGNAYKLGVYYDTGEFDHLSEDGEARNGNYGFYVAAQQMVYGEPGSDDGLTLWATGTLAPDEDVNTFPYFLSGGVLYEGLIPGRGEDVAALGAAYGRLSRELEGQDYEMVLEWTYACQVFQWLVLQPDVQWIINPGGTGDIPDALVAGVQVSLDL